jgi:hypothetical protein
MKRGHWFLDPVPSDLNTYAINRIIFENRVRNEYNVTYTVGIASGKLDSKPALPHIMFVFTFIKGSGYGALFKSRECFAAN